MNEVLRQASKVRHEKRMEAAKVTLSNAHGKHRWSYGGMVVRANSRSEARAKFKVAFGLTRLPPNTVVKKEVA